MSTGAAMGEGLTSATRLLHQERRSIEQALALALLCVDDDGAAWLEALVSDLTTLLATEEKIFFPAVENALGRPPAQRALHARVRHALARATVPRLTRGRRRKRIFALIEAFRAHARLEERLAFTIEGAMGERWLEALGSKMRAFRHAAA